VDREKSKKVMHPAQVPARENHETGKRLKGAILLELKMIRENHLLRRTIIGGWKSSFTLARGSESCEWGGK